MTAERPDPRARGRRLGVRAQGHRADARRRRTTSRWWASPADGEEGLAKARELRPDVVTLDVKMPRLGGLETLERLMAEQPVPGPADVHADPGGGRGHAARARARGHGLRRQVVRAAHEHAEPRRGARREGPRPRRARGVRARPRPARRRAREAAGRAAGRVRRDRRLDRRARPRCRSSSPACPPASRRRCCRAAHPARLHEVARGAARRPQRHPGARGARRRGGRARARC